MTASSIASLRFGTLAHTRPPPRGAARHHAPSNNPPLVCAAKVLHCRDVRSRPEAADTKDSWRPHHVHHTEKVRTHSGLCTRMSADGDVPPLGCMLVCHAQTTFCSAPVGQSSTHCRLTLAAPLWCRFSIERMPDAFGGECDRNNSLSVLVAPPSQWNG